MSTSRFGVVVDALISVLTSAGVTVVDGSPLRDAEVGKDVVYVGWDGSANGQAGDTRQDWAGIGNKARDELISVTCYAEASRGAVSAKTVRDAALVLLGDVETALRADPQLGGALTGPSYAQLADTRLVQLQTTSGARCGVVFTVNAFARI